jgi:hypothetical protein
MKRNSGRKRVLSSTDFSPSEQKEESKSKQAKTKTLTPPPPPPRTGAAKPTLSLKSSSSPSNSSPNDAFEDNGKMGFSEATTPHTTADDDEFGEWIGADVPEEVLEQRRQKWAQENGNDIIIINDPRSINHGLRFYKKRNGKMCSPDSPVAIQGFLPGNSEDLSGLGLCAFVTPTVLPISSDACSANASSCSSSLSSAFMTAPRIDQNSQESCHFRIGDSVVASARFEKGDDDDNAYAGPSQRGKIHNHHKSMLKTLAHTKQ